MKYKEYEKLLELLQVELVKQFMYVATTDAIIITVNSVIGGLIQLALDLLKAGGLVCYISNAVLIGFMTGVVLAMGQFIYQSSTGIRIAELVMQPDGSFVERPMPKQLSPHSIVVLMPYGSLHFAGASSLERKSIYRISSRAIWPASSPLTRSICSSRRSETQCAIAWSAPGCWRTSVTD